MLDLLRIPEHFVLLTDVINELDILADQLEQEAKKTTVYEVELAPEIRNTQQPW